MFLSLPTAAYRDQWVAFTLKDCDAKIIYFNIVRFVDLTSLEGFTMPDGCPVVYLEVIDNDVDRVKLANRMIGEMQKRAAQELQWRVVEIVKSWTHGNKRYGRPVSCVETGERYVSVKACADANNLSYSQLINHLKNMVGYKTVKGRHYKWLE